ncbi:MAG: TatD family hydrolase [Pseudomonadota bacterium]|nr:TatD family hydrolase [Pseudomonadota bacterium]
MNEHPLHWFDSHCHFDFPVFDPDREQVWQQAQQAGVRGLLIPGISREQGQRLPAFCHNRPWFYAFGLHPYFLDQHQPQDEDWLAAALQRDAPVAVGEIGLDRVLADTGERLQQQWHWFRLQVALADDAGLPLILHIRGMHDEAASFLRRQRFTAGGMVHAFSGSEQQAKAWLDLGFALGVGGAMTHPRATRLRRTLAALPVESLLLETDSPDMAPAFWAESRNSPLALPVTAVMLAALKGLDPAQLASAQAVTLRQTFPRLSG